MPLAAGAYFEPLSLLHFDFIRISPDGTAAVADAVQGPRLGFWTTEAHITVPCLRAGITSSHHSHHSATRSETIDALSGLMGYVFLPLVPAFDPTAQNNPDLYGVPSIEHIMWAQLNPAAKTVEAQVSIPACVEGVPNFTTTVTVPISDDDLTTLLGMMSEYVIPAIKLETGLL